MLTKQQIVEYLPDYSLEIILKALNELAKYDESIDPNSEQFEEDIVERLEDVLGSIEKSIQDTPSQITEAKQYALQLIKEKGIYVEEQLVEELFHLCVEEGIARAKVFHQVGMAAFNSTLAHLQGEELKAATEQHIQKLHAFNLMMCDGSALDTMLQNYEIGSIDNAVKTVSIDAEDFDIEQYQKEILAGIEEPKKPTTRYGAKQLLRAMLG